MAASAVHPVKSDPELAAHAVAYHRFMLGVKWVMVSLGSFIIFATLSFGTSAGPVWGVIVGLLVFSIGVFAMGHGLGHSTESDNPTD